MAVTTVVLLFAAVGSEVVEETVEAAVIVGATTVGGTFTTTMMSATRSRGQGRIGASDSAGATDGGRGAGPSGRRDHGLIRRVGRRRLTETDGRRRCWTVVGDGLAICDVIARQDRGRRCCGAESKVGLGRGSNDVGRDGRVRAKRLVRCVHRHGVGDDSSGCSGTPDL